MAEESTKKRGRLAAAVIAGSTLAFGSFAMGMPAALADEEEEPRAAVATQEADESTAEPEPTDEASTEPAEDNAGADEDNTPASDEGEDAEPSATPMASETTDTVEPLQEDPEDDGEEEPAIPTIEADVYEGTPGSIVNISGIDFGPGNQVEVRLESASADVDSILLLTETANENGELNVPVTIPEGTALGEYNIVAHDEAANTNAGVSFSVIEEPDENGDEGQEVDPTLYINPGSGPSGTTITLNGSGYSEGGDINVSVAPADGGDAVLSDTFTADEYGWIDSHELTIPEDTANGVYHVTTVDAETDEAADVAVFNVTDITLTVAPETISEEDFREAGVNLTVEGLESGDVVDFDFGSAYSPIPALEGSATADDDGIAEYLVQGTEGDVFVGTYTVGVTHADDDLRVASGEFEVTSELPQVSVAPQEPTDDGAVLQGELLNVSAYNVTPDNSVTVDFGIEGVAEEQLETEDSGEFFTEFEVPEDTEPGVKELTVTDDETGAVGTAEYTVADASDDGEVIEPTLSADREQITLEEFVGAAEDEPGVHFTVEGLDAYTDITYTVVAPGNVEGLDQTTSTNENGVARFFIHGFDWVSDPTVYLGEYAVTVTYDDEAGETQELGPETFTVVEELETGPQISLESNEVYQGGALDVEISNLTPDGDVTVEWNPTETMTADANGNIDTELAIAEDAATGVQTLTVTDETTDESNSVEYTVLDASDQVVDPALTIDPERITLDDFVGDPDDGAGVAHVVEGLQPETEISYLITAPGNVNDYESTATADEDGVAQFVIHGYDVADPSVYLGEYNTVVTYTDEDGDTAALNGSFTVVSGDGDGAAPGGTDDSDEAESAGPVDLNGYNGLAQTGATGMQLGFLAGGLLLLGAAFVAFANRARLFPRKN